MANSFYLIQRTTRVDYTRDCKNDYCDKKRQISKDRRATKILTCDSSHFGSVSSLLASSVSLTVLPRSTACHKINNCEKRLYQPYDRLTHIFFLSASQRRIRFSQTKLRKQRKTFITVNVMANIILCSITLYKKMLLIYSFIDYKFTIN